MSPVELLSPIKSLELSCGHRYGKRGLKQKTTSSYWCEFVNLNSLRSNHYADLPHHLPVCWLRESLKCASLTRLN
nr:hypothetical transcript [Hymenolepis microstoma]